MNNQDKVVFGLCMISFILGGICGMNFVIIVERCVSWVTRRIQPGLQ